MSAARRLSRRWLTGLCLTTTLVPMTLGAVGIASAGTSSPYGTPFREDGAQYNAATDTFSGGFAKGGATDANGCVASANPQKSTGAPKGNPNAYDCLPAGASMVMLPNGKIVFWNALEGEEGITGTNTLLTDGGKLTVNDESRYLDLSGSKPVFTKPSPVDAGAHQTDHPDDLPLGPFSAQHYSYNNGSMFCSDQVLLANGDVIDAGGTDYYSEPYVPKPVDKGVIELQGVKNTRIFNAQTKSWTAGPTMNYGRWYPSIVTQGNGDLFIASGVNKLIKPVYPSNPADSGTNLKQTETLTTGSSKNPQWVKNGATADRSLPLFPRLHLLPNGHVYYDAAGQDFNPFGQSYDEATWNTAATYDPAAKSWTDLGVPGLDTAAADPSQAPYAGFRGSTFSAALTMRPSGADRTGAPQYTAASYLTAGGVLGVSPGSYLAVANSRITTIDSAVAGAEKMTTVHTGDLAKGRWYGTATPLPNGQVYVSSGADVDEVLNPGQEHPIRSTELFTPKVDKAGHYTGGTWADAGNQARKRTYHNNAVLMPDGNVLIGGHAPIAAGYAQTMDGTDLGAPGQPPVLAGTNNHHDASFQLWQPPYVGKPGRPSVSGLQAAGRTLVVHTSDAANIASVVLMRNTAETHLVDGDARTVSLPVVGRDTGAGTVTVALPSTTNVLPNGPYLLFANKTTTADMSGTNAADLLPSQGTELFITGAGRKATTPVAFLPRAARAAAAAPTSSAAAPAGASAAGGSSATPARQPAAAPSGTTRTATAGTGTTPGAATQAGAGSTAPAGTAVRSRTSGTTTGRTGSRTGPTSRAGNAAMTLAAGSAPLALDGQRDGSSPTSPALPVAGLLVVGMGAMVTRQFRLGRRGA